MESNDEIMTITCNQLDDLLLDGDPQSLEIAALHAETCAACMEKLASWNEISDVARTMQTTWQSDLLWPRIERAITAEKRASRSHVWRIAAAVALTVALGAMTWYALRVHNRRAAFDKELLTSEKVDNVEKAEEAYAAAIQQLEKSAEPKLENDEASPLMVSYKEKLMVLDDAIAECQSNIDRNRQNAHLRNQLLTMYSEKQKTLRDVIREGHNVQQP
ncbi:MAG TPA: hypothetical protein VMU84_07340 [Thermoanaerobaculia bacterium]|nr:hypothetical protein [Thermoanaerobaculia bacterium]